MNDQNLKPIRSVSEAREKGRRGGIASGVARRHKASLREAIRIALMEPDTNMFNEPIPGTTRLGGAAAELVKKAAGGDLKAIALLLKLEEQPKEDPAGEEV